LSLPFAFVNHDLLCFCQSLLALPLPLDTHFLFLRILRYQVDAAAALLVGKATKAAKAQARLVSNALFGSGDRGGGGGGVRASLAYEYERHNGGVGGASATKTAAAAVGGDALTMSLLEASRRRNGADGNDTHDNIDGMHNNANVDDGGGGDGGDGGGDGGTFLTGLHTDAFDVAAGAQQSSHSSANAVGDVDDAPGRWCECSSVTFIWVLSTLRTRIFRSIFNLIYKFNLHT
jgi:hypothetical protein